MKRPLRHLSACLCATAAIGAAPPGTASAKDQCLFQGARASAGTVGKVERSLLCLTNVHRVRNDLTPLRRDTRLGTAARAHSADMVARDYFDHFSPEGDGPSERVQAAGYPSGAGENIATNGTGTALSLFQQWRNSSGHNQNMLGSGYTAGGFGVAVGFPGGRGGGGAVTGTQDFGSAPANTGDTALGLYASSPKCAKAKLAKLRSKGKKRKRAARKVRSRCQAP
jgi:uncharacterized protein YkwD